MARTGDTAVNSELEDAILSALREVDDPELGVNIVDLGLVISIRIDERAVIIDLMMTTPTCPLGGLIAETAVVAVEERLGPDYTVHVTLDRSAIWSPDRAVATVRTRFERPPSRIGEALKAGVRRLVGVA